MGSSFQISGFPVGSDNVALDILDLDGMLEIGRSSCYERPEEATCRPIINRNEAERAAFYASLLQSDTVLLLGIYRETGTKRILCGQISLADYNPRNGSLEIGYYLLPSERGHGLMRRAIYNLLTFLFRLKEPDIRKITAQTGAFNRASVKLLTQAGFQRDGVLRQHHELHGQLFDDYLFSILKSDYNRLSAVSAQHV